MRTPSPPLPAKRPRGLWTGRREARHAKTAGPSHDPHSDALSTADTASDLFDDDFDDDHSSDASFKRRRLSGALSDSDTLYHQSPSSRALTPDPCYHASCFPSQIPTVSPSLSMDVTARSSINSESPRSSLALTDLEDWENLKELFARASRLYDCDETEDALALLRAVIRECHRFLLAHPDPSAVYACPDASHALRSPDALSHTEDRRQRGWASHPHASRKPVDPPTAFHAVFGTALYLMGSIISQDPTLALPDEPSAPSTYWLGALDVFETGEHLSSILASSSSIQDDWRMYVSWGHTLISLAEEKLESSSPADIQPALPLAPPDLKALRNGLFPYLQPSAGSFSPVEPRWPPQSPFHIIAATRPPVTRRMSLYSASAHDVMILAMDQFSRGIFHMPHAHYSATHNPTSIHSTNLPISLDSSLNGTTLLSAFHSQRHSSSSTPPHAPTPDFSRPKELFNIATALLGIAERLPRAPEREHWAAQADAVLAQMKMEADSDAWRAPVTAARGRAWLVVGEARAGRVEDKLERGEDVLGGEDAREAREGLEMAVAFLERAKGATTDSEQEDLAPLLAEALLTLANLTADENTREELYARAQAECGATLALELDPPAIAAPPVVPVKTALEAVSPTFVFRGAFACGVTCGWQIHRGEERLVKGS